MSKTIFITGASKGLGYLWTEAFLKRGDKVAATSRDTKGLQDLADKYGDSFLPIQLDITDKDAVNAAVTIVKDHFGGLDVVINNAGYGVFGAVEEVNEKEARDVFDANVFGSLFVTQAALPIFRAQGHGHVILLSSVLGVFTLPTFGIYNATKFAIEGLGETLASEVKDFGINVTLVEPNGYATEFGGSSAVISNTIDAYNPVREILNAAEGMQDANFGVPEATVPAILKLIDEKNPPLRYFLGKVGLPVAKEIYKGRLAEWEKYADVANAAHGK